jgi:hypothetical protein
MIEIALSVSAMRAIAPFLQVAKTPTCGRNQSPKTIALRSFPSRRQKGQISPREPVSRRDNYFSAAYQLPQGFANLWS